MHTHFSAAVAAAYAEDASDRALDLAHYIGSRIACAERRYRLLDGLDHLLGVSHVEDVLYFPAATGGDVWDADAACSAAAYSYDAAAAEREQALREVELTRLSR